MKFEINGEALEASHDNTILNLHYREHEYDHILIRKEKAGLVLAYFIFRPNIEDFDTVAGILVDEQYPAMMRPVATPETAQRFNEQFTLEATFPEEWAK